MAKQNTASVEKRTAVDNVGSIFTARRDLRHVVKQLVKGSGLAVEEADILVFLYGMRKLGWTDCASYDGYVNLTDLKAITVHDPGLLTRRIQAFGNKVSMRNGRTVDPTLHPKSKQVRIEAPGIKAIEPIWEKYCRFSEQLLKGFTQTELDAHLNVNEGISSELRKRRDPATYLLGVLS